MARTDFDHPVSSCSEAFHTKRVLRHYTGYVIAIMTPCEFADCTVKLEGVYDRATRLVLAGIEHSLHNLHYSFGFGTIDPGDWETLRKRYQRHKGWLVKIPTEGGIWVLGSPGDRLELVPKSQTPPPNVPKSHIWGRGAIYGTWGQEDSGSPFQDTCPEDSVMSDPIQHYFYDLHPDPLGATIAGIHAVDESLLDNLYDIGTTSPRAAINLLTGAMRSATGNITRVGLSTSNPRRRVCIMHGEVWNVAERRRSEDRECAWCGAPTSPRYTELGWTSKQHSETDILFDNALSPTKITKSGNATIYKVKAL